VSSAIRSAADIGKWCAHSGQVEWRWRSRGRYTAAAQVGHFTHSSAGMSAIRRRIAAIRPVLRLSVI